MPDRTQIIVDPDKGAEQHRDVTPGALSGWVLERVSSWEDFRKQHLDHKWDEYYRLWRGMWSSEDKTRDSERSRLISPALSQAIEATVSELEEATFGSGKWFDVSDNYGDDDTADVQMWRDQLDEDFDKENVRAGVAEVFLNGALYGTGIGKLILKEVTERRIIPNRIGESDINEVGVEERGTVRVAMVPIHPKEFVIDPTARNIEEALGMAHITTVPKHVVEQKQKDGTYRDVTVGSYSPTVLGGDERDDNRFGIREEDKTMIVEYHGLVPRALLLAVQAADNPELELAEEELMLDDTDLVEAIVTIANGSTLLRAIENPYVMKDRCFVAYQHDTVPNRFWGRGVAEKGYNPQKALDAELRGRIDAMALSIHPMMAMDASRLPRGANFKVAPGRSVLTNGNPRDILMPFNFGQVNPVTFSQSGEMERMIQIGTGAMDSASPLGTNRRNETAGGMSMIQGGSIKRSKRTMANIERNFTKPFINKAAWRYMQFAPDRYPVQDISFNVHGTLGIMAREIEQANLANMMKTVPSESPAFWMLLKGVFEHSDLSIREEMMPVIDQMMQVSLKKQAQPQQDPLVEVKMQEIQMEAQLEQAKLAQKADKDNKDLAMEVKRLELEYNKLQLKREEILLDARIALAEQEQDSMVTAVQMETSERDSQRRAMVQAMKGGGNGKAG